MGSQTAAIGPRILKKGSQVYWVTKWKLHRLVPTMSQRQTELQISMKKRETYKKLGKADFFLSVEFLL